MPDLRAFSGISHFMATHLQEAGVEVHYVQAPLPPPSWGFRLRRKLYKKLGGWGLREDRDPTLTGAAGRQLDRLLGALLVDFILSPGSLGVARLRDPRPKFFWSDATFDGYIDFSEEFTDMSPETIRQGHQLEQRSLDNVRRAFYSSDWAAETARHFYRVDPAKIKVIPFGANFQSVPSRNEVLAAIDRRDPRQYRLLFCGVEWERKGGPLALDVLRTLLRRGRPASLQLIGCQPAIPEDLRPHVVTHGFISKKTSEGQAKMNELFQESHYLILPARQEACAIAFCEASAYGLPVLASQVGGCSTVVQEGINGRLFPVGVSPETIADFLEPLADTPGSYHRLARRTREEFDKRLNWPTAIAHFLEEVRGCLNEDPSGRSINP